MRNLAKSVTCAILIGLLFVFPSSFSAAQSDEARSLYERGLEKNKRGKLIAASVLFTEAIAIEPDYADAYYHRGLSFIGMKRKAKGMEDFYQAIGYKIQDLNPYIQLIQWHNDHHRYPAALIITDQIIANMPENAAGAYWDKGQAYERMNKNKLAIAAYEASLAALDSDNADFALTLRSRIKELKK